MSSDSCGCGGWRRLNLKGKGLYDSVKIPVSFVSGELDVTTVYISKGRYRS